MDIEISDPDEITIDLDFSRSPKPKCKHCKKQKGDHRAQTFECPRGTRTGIGYTTYGPTTFEVK